MKPKFIHTPTGVEAYCQYGYIGTFENELLARAAVRDSSKGEP